MNLNKSTEIFAFNIVRTAKIIKNMSDFPSQYGVASSGIERNRKYWTHIAQRTAIWFGAYETPLSRFPLLNILSRVPTSMQYLRKLWLAKICKNSRCKASCFFLATNTWNRFLLCGVASLLVTMGHMLVCQWWICGVTVCTVW